MNLREFISDMECHGMPEYSECQIMILNGREPLTLKSVGFDMESHTVWLVASEDF